MIRLGSQGFTSVRAIAAQLNGLCILTPPGGAWHRTSAARLLSRLRLADLRQPGVSLCELIYFFYFFTALSRYGSSVAVILLVNY
jgi:hypothetical protein